MSVKFRQYRNTSLYGDDYKIVRDFLIELDSYDFHFGVWDWMFICLGAEWADPDSLEKIGLWEDGKKLVAVAAYETTLGSIYILTLNGYEKLKEEMLLYAKDNLVKNGELRVLILDNDLKMQSIAARNNFYPTQDKWSTSIYQIDQEKINYCLPEGFKITSFEEDFDLYKYGQVMWKGFNNEINGKGPFSFYWEKCSKKRYIKAWDRPNIDLRLKIFIVAPNGDFVSHCGIWYDQKLKNVLIEPVATEPAYRKMGLGKSVVLEGIRRCSEFGVIRAIVNSSQQFYYNIGFRPFATSTWWEKK